MISKKRSHETVNHCFCVEGGSWYGAATSYSEYKGAADKR
ncbi:hypothetical protein PROSTU_04576 [Providencia stuartii ATCC 25827]|uniref:Uncharacterized protein n=1 Tax=Providencia stuartii ATCC 25827 TaxID=471874 RepID=A0AA87CS82_PROST|nr:hypothetical protein PROSTU_04576 [Providencia stuartii ATCC 25827]